MHPAAIIPYAQIRFSKAAARSIAIAPFAVSPLKFIFNHFRLAHAHSSRNRITGTIERLPLNYPLATRQKIYYNRSKRRISFLATARAVKEEKKKKDPSIQGNSNRGSRRGGSIL